MAENSEALVQERHVTHGDFAENAIISQTLKQFVRAYLTGTHTEVMRESLDMICLKLSRILSGRFDEPDHWRDIAGYAQLVLQSGLERRSGGSEAHKDMIARTLERLLLDFSGRLDGDIMLKAVTEALALILCGNHHSPEPWNCLVTVGETMAKRYA